MRRQLAVSEGAANVRLDVFLATNLDMTRSHAHRLLRAGEVSVNGARQRPSYQVQAGDEIALDSPEIIQPAVPVPELSVVYEDDDLLVVDKPAGLIVHTGSGTAGEPTVADFARSRTSDPDPERAGIVHRLDRNTSGLMVIAKTLTAKNHLQQLFRNRAMSKTYTLLAVGRVSPPEAVIRLPLDRDPANPLRRAVVAGGRASVTRYQTQADYPGYTLVQAQPETGRTHQIRVHFAAIGHPVAGDSLYGAPTGPHGLSRQFLHASTLKFLSPSGRHLELTSPLPDDLASVIRAFENQV